MTLLFKKKKKEEDKTQLLDEFFVYSRDHGFKYSLLDRKRSWESFFLIEVVHSLLAFNWPESKKKKDWV